MGGLSIIEQYSHMSLWCIAGAPLLVGTDLVHASNETLRILTNPEVIAINQDLGYKGAIQGTISSTDPGANVEVWSKRLAEGESYGVVLLNVGEAVANVTSTWKAIGVSGSATVRDLWAQKDRGLHTDSFTAEVQPHGTVFVRVTQQSSLLVI